MIRNSLQLVKLLTAPRIAGLLPATIEANRKPSTTIETALVPLMQELMKAAASYVSGAQSGFDFLCAETDFVAQVRALRMATRASTAAKEPPRPSYPKRIPTPAEIDFDISATFQRCHDLFQNARQPSLPTLEITQ